MFILGHIGFTLGLFLLIILSFKRSDIIQKIDLRIMVFFALLPDITDKIIGHLILHETLNNGRLFCHSLLFWFVFSIIFFIIVRKYWWVYSFSVLGHQVFDHMWTSPRTWFWPILGIEFDYFDIDFWDRWLTALISDPYISSTEIVGIIIISLIFINYKLYKRDNFLNIIKTGRLKIK